MSHFTGEYGITRDQFKNLGKNKKESLNRIQSELDKEKERTLRKLWTEKEKK